MDDDPVSSAHLKCAQSMAQSIDSVGKLFKIQRLLPLSQRKDMGEIARVRV
ncbi:hypothetical protein BGC_00490 [Burkholderia sp. 3C]